MMLCNHNKSLVSCISIGMTRSTNVSVSSSVLETSHLPCFWKKQYPVLSLNLSLSVRPVVFTSTSQKKNSGVDIIYPPLEPKLIYTHVAIFLAVGFLLSAKVKIKELSLVYAGQLLYFAYNTYSNPKLRYTETQRMRMAIRQVGCAGIFVLFSYFNDSAKSKQLRKIGETIIGIFLMAYVYMINTTYEDKQAFLTHLPGDDWSRYFITLILACGSISFFSGYFLRDVSASLAVIMAILTIVIDCDIRYWVDKRGMYYWNQVRVVTDDLCIILGLCLFVTRGDNKVKVE